MTKSYILPKAVTITNKGITVLYKGSEIIVKSIHKRPQGNLHQEIHQIRENLLALSEKRV